MSFWLPILLKPFFALVIFGLIALPLRLLFQRYWPEGKFKRLLLRPVGGPQGK